jgi:hypothetical protein
MRRDVQVRRAAPRFLDLRDEALDGLVGEVGDQLEVLVHMQHDPIAELGGRGDEQNWDRWRARSMSWAERTEYPTSNNVTAATCTNPCCMRSAHCSACELAPRRTTAELSMSQEGSLTTRRRS